MKYYINGIIAVFFLLVSHWAWSQWGRYIPNVGKLRNTGDIWYTSRISVEETKGNQRQRGPYLSDYLREDFLSFLVASFAWFWKQCFSNHHVHDFHRDIKELKNWSHRSEVQPIVSSVSRGCHFCCSENHTWNIKLYNVSVAMNKVWELVICGMLVQAQLLF